jgi:hypothetical protein
MKRKLLIISFLCFINAIYSQDSMRLTTEVDTFTPPQYLSDYDAFFMENLPIRKAVKMSFSGSSRDYRFQSQKIFFGYEYKFNKNISINAGIQSVLYSATNFSETQKSNVEKANFSYIEAGLIFEPRLYFNKHNKVNNLNGNYASILTKYDPKRTSFSYELTFGIQRQTINTNLTTSQNKFMPCYIDASIGLGFEIEKNTLPQPAFHYQILVGGLTSKLFGRSNAKDVIPSTADLRNDDFGWQPDNRNGRNIFRLFEGRKHQFKVDLMNIVNQLNQNGFIGETSLAYERKLGKSAFTINTETNFQVGNLKNQKDANRYIEGYTWKFSIEPRYFYSKKRGVTLDEPTDNLSGSFAAIQFGFQNQEWREIASSRLEDLKNHKQYISAVALWGAQTRVFNNFFVEVKLGLGVKTPKTETLDFFQKYEAAFIPFDFKVGFIF